MEDFKYLGSYVASTIKDIQVRKALAWKALEALDVFWKSGMSKKVKIKIFRTAVEPVLLYGSETWSLKVSDSRAIDGVYTRMFRRVCNISWKSHTPNTELYGKIPKLSATIMRRRLRFAGHLARHDDQPANRLNCFGNHHAESATMEVPGIHTRVFYSKIMGSSARNVTSTPGYA